MEGVQSLVHLLWPLNILPDSVLQLHNNDEKISVAAYGYRKNCKKWIPHLSEKLLEETPMQQEVKERTVVILGSKGEG